MPLRHLRCGEVCCFEATDAADSNIVSDTRGTVDQTRATPPCVLHSWAVRSLFIINENSGRKRDRDALARTIESACSGDPHEIARTTSVAELDALFEPSTLANFDVVWAVGGDGTVNEIGKRLVGTNKALGVVPTGSGNGFARHMHIPIDAAAAVAARKRSEIVAIDTAVVNEHCFLGTFGIGFDALVASRFAGAGTRGLETYIREALKAFIAFTPEEYEITVDGTAMRETAFLLAVGNSNQYGNEAKIAPLASLRDGLLDLAVLRDHRIVDAPDIIRRLFFGTLRDCSYLHTRRGRSIRIVRKNDGPAHIDGDPIVLGRELNVEIRPKSLNVIVSKDALRSI